MTSKSDNLRYSIIPARAVTDPNITAQALRVLALLGRHAADNGWCRRSQVTMAKELACSRGTIQNALDLLIGQENGTGYVERREETRIGVRPEEGRHPHCAYSYRVRLDLDDGERAEGANRLARGSASQKAPGATPDKHPVPASLAPLTEHSPCERSPLEHAREGDASLRSKVWPAFLKWPGLPTSASEARTAAVLARLDVPPLDDLIACIEAHGAHLAAENHRRGRGGPAMCVTPHNWLERDRGWEKYLGAVRGAHADAAAGEERAGRVMATLGADVHVRLRRAKLNEGEISALDGVSFAAGPPPVFSVASARQETILRKHHMELDEIWPGVRFENSRAERMKA